MLAQAPEGDASQAKLYLHQLGLVKPREYVGKFRPSDERSEEGCVEVFKRTLMYVHFRRNYRIMPVGMRSEVDAVPVSEGFAAVDFKVAKNDGVLKYINASRSQQMMAVFFIFLIDGDDLYLVVKKHPAFTGVMQN
jgi:hypothetical protein